ncbi:hypothetical protein ARMGADRAFT_590197 [Armillaria gallica]|uniref:Uncharacterized protein n=1 Tax=Armillaria gallica TaxID=47427 RepID=A0A2H3DY79_ARMGA|nr:hypothetical protein ARMGADRAFT_590197 [Armillaria gallica]
MYPSKSPNSIHCLTMMRYAGRTALWSNTTSSVGPPFSGCASTCNDNCYSIHLTEVYAHGMVTLIQLFLFMVFFAQPLRVSQDYSRY